MMAGGNTTDEMPMIPGGVKVVTADDATTRNIPNIMYQLPTNIFTMGTDGNMGSRATEKLVSITIMVLETYRTMLLYTQMPK